MFLFDSQPVPYCSVYKYLGANINEYLDFTFTANCLADTAGRALSSTVTKMIKNGGFPYNVYTVLYNACVTSITDYASVNVGVLSEVDWLLPEYRTQLKMIGQYQRMLKMTNCRLTKKVYLWDRALNDSGALTSWNSEIKKVFYSCNQHSIYDNNVPFSLKNVVQSIKQIFIKDQALYLKSECEEMPKLRTFLKFKQFDQLPAYVNKPLTFLQKKAPCKDKAWVPWN